MPLIPRNLGKHGYLQTFTSSNQQDQAPVHISASSISWIGDFKKGGGRYEDGRGIFSGWSVKGGMGLRGE